MRKVLISIAVILLLLLMAVIVVAQNGYDIPWWSVDGGAQTSSGDGFNLSAIAGQPDAGVVLSGGAYVVSGGYWSAAERGGFEPEQSAYLPMIVK